MPSPPGCAQDSQPLHHPGSSPGALTAPSQVPRPPSQHLQDPQLTTRMGASTTPILQTRKLRPCHLPKDSSEEAEEGTTLNHTARWPPATLRTSRSSHCQLTHFLLELGGLAVQEGEVRVSQGWAPCRGSRGGSFPPLAASGGSRHPSLGWWPPPSRLRLHVHMASPLCPCLSSSVSYEDPVPGFRAIPIQEDLISDPSVHHVCRDPVSK